MTVTPLREIETEALPLMVQFQPVIEMTEEQFFLFCQINRDLRIERTAEGMIIIMPPTGSQTGKSNFSLAVQVGIWAERDGTGIGFDSSTGFTLPNGAMRSPDVSWIKKERWEKLSPQEKEKFAPIYPDFVIELKSPTDNFKSLKEKMQEYIDNGTSLGWLIHPGKKQVYVYRANQEVECLENPVTLSGESLLKDFVLDLSKIW